MSETVSQDAGHGSEGKQGSNTRTHRCQSTTDLRRPRAASQLADAYTDVNVTLFFQPAQALLAAKAGAAYISICWPLGRH